MTMIKTAPTTNSMNDLLKRLGIIATLSFFGLTAQVYANDEVKFSLPFKYQTLKMESFGTQPKLF